MTETKKRKMSAAQRRARKRKIRNRRIAMTFALVLVVALASVGGTIAWLTDKTDPVTNTFTVGNIDIELDETTGATYKMVPGGTISKDPKVTVKGGSEKCYLFVKVEKGNNLDNFITYSVDTSIWTALTGEDGVYYQVVDEKTTDQVFNVLTNNQVTVKDSVTKTMMDGLTDTTRPTLTFTAYACQYLKHENNPAGAWQAAQPTTTPGA